MERKKGDMSRLCASIVRCARRKEKKEKRKAPRDRGSGDATKNTGGGGGERLVGGGGALRNVRDFWTITTSSSNYWGGKIWQGLIFP